MSANTRMCSEYMRRGKTEKNVRLNEKFFLHTTWPNLFCGLFSKLSVFQIMQRRWKVESWMMKQKRFFKRRSHCQIEQTIPGFPLRGYEKSWDASARTESVWTEIRTGQLQNTREERCQYRGADKSLARPDWKKNNWKVAIFRPTRRSMLLRRPGWTEKFSKFFWVACKS